MKAGTPGWWRGHRHSGDEKEKAISTPGSGACQALGNRFGATDGSDVERGTGALGCSLE